MNCVIVWSCKWSPPYANMHPVNSCWLLCNYGCNMIAVKYCSMPFIVFHYTPPLYNHIQGWCNINITGHNKKKKIMTNTMSKHFARLRRTKQFSSAVSVSMDASMHAEDEATFGCSINFKGFYTIKHNLSRGYYILLSLSFSCLFFSLMFLLH